MKNKKLVSKNPVLRFQQGKRLVYGDSPHEILGARLNGNELGWVNIPGKGYVAIDKGGKVYKFIPAGRLFVDVSPTIYDYEMIDKAVRNGGVTSRTTDLANSMANTWISSNFANKKRLARINVNNKRRLTTTTNPIQQTPLPNGAFLQSPRNNGTPPAGNGRRRNIPTTTTPAVGNGVGNTPIYYTTRAYRNAVLPEGLNSREAVKAFLEQIGMTEKDLDGIWGDKTQAAYDRWKNNLKLLASTSVSPGTPVSPIVNFSVEEEIGNGLLPSINNWTAKAKALKDLKYTLNPIFTNQTLLAKKGGQLISKNPIERFLLGKKLPTAPKAEDRYRNGRRTWNTPFYKEVSSASNIFGDPLASRIAMEVSNNGNDTTFYETPGRWLPVNVRTRTASKKNQNFRTILGPRLSTEESKTIIIDPEYETLKRRFNTAWNLAK